MRTFIGNVLRISQTELGQIFSQADSHSTESNKCSRQLHFPTKFQVVHLYKLPKYIFTEVVVSLFHLSGGSMKMIKNTHRHK